MSPGKVKPTIAALRIKKRMAKKRAEPALAEATLRESEERYRTLADATPMMMWRSGPDKLCTYFNSGWLAFTGRTLEAELGDGWLAGVHPDDVERCLGTYAFSFAQRESFEMEYRLRHHSGEYRWILDRGAPLYSLSGTFLGYTGGCIDIHDHKLAEQELRRKQEQLRQALALTQAIKANRGEGFYTLDTGGLLTYINSGAERLLGWSSAELMGRKIHDIIHYKHSDGSPFPAAECPGLKVLETGSVLRNQRDLFIRKDGRFLEVTYNSSAIRSDDGIIRGTIVAFRAMTNRETALDDLHDDIDALIAAAPQGRILPVKPAAMRLFGYASDEEAEGKNISMLTAELYAREYIAHALETRARQQSAVAELGRRALAVADSHSLMEDACVLVGQTLGVEFCKILQFLPERDAFLLVAGVGWKQGLVGNALVPAAAESQAGYTLVNGERVVVENLSTEGRFRAPALLREHGIVSGMSVVIRGRDRSFGVLGAHTATRRSFSDEDSHFLEAVANVLSAAVERFRGEEELSQSRQELRALAARLQAAREEERTALAREIHDELSGSLTALKIDISLLPDRAAKDRALLLEKLTFMTALIDNTLERMHTIVTELRPVILDKFGLVAAIEWQASEFQRRSGIVCECDLPADELPFEEARSTAIFRIFQEALTNVLRHAEATQVAVVLGRGTEGMRLAVVDNGKGIDEKAIHAQSSLGLVGMRERALAFGGALEISRAPRQGTQVVVKIPMQ